MHSAKMFVPDDIPSLMVQMDLVDERIFPSESLWNQPSSVEVTFTFKFYGTDVISKQACIKVTSQGLEFSYLKIDQDTTQQDKFTIITIPNLVLYGQVKPQETEIKFK